MSKETVKTKLFAGFARLPKNLGKDYNIDYPIGETKTIKANMKDAEFQMLGGGSLGGEIEVHLLKNVPLKKAVLYPSNEDGKEPSINDWQHLFYTKDNQLCSTLIKTYSLNQWNIYLDDLSQAKRNEGVEIDYTSVYTTLVAAKTKEKNAHGSNINRVEFYFCKDAKGKPCRYWDTENNCKNEDAVIQAITEEDFNNMSAFVSEHFGSIYDARTIEEYINKNIPAEKVKDMPINEQIVGAAYSIGYMNRQEAEKVMKELSVGKSIALPAIEAAE